MPIELVESKEAESATRVIKYPIAEAAISKMADEFMPLTIDGIEDKDGFKAVHDARMIVKNHRVAVEKTRKELKADALAYGRSVDSEAKRLTEMLTPIEEHLTAEETAINDAKELLRQQAAAAARQQLEDRLAKLNAVNAVVSVSKLEEMSEDDFAMLLETATIRFNEQQAAEAKIAEEKRIAEEQEKAERAAEAQRLAEEKARLDAEAERLSEIQRKQDEAQSKIDEEKSRLALEAEQRRQQVLIAEAERKAAEAAKAEAEARHQEEARRAKVLEELAEKKRLHEEACRPDREKLLGLCLLLDKLIIPEVGPEMADARKCVVTIIKGASFQIREAVGEPVSKPANPFSVLGS